MTQHVYENLGPCELFPNAVNPDGYGILFREGKKWTAHRWTYTKAHGPIPEGLQVRHKCDNPRCIRLDHLELGTHGDNMKDRRERKRYHKLTRADADAIKSRLGYRNGAALAREFGVSASEVYHIRDGRQWS